MRYNRAELHEDGLITDDEYAELLNVGSQSARRLEEYDTMRAELARLRAPRVGVEDVIARLRKIAKRRAVSSRSRVWESWQFEREELFSVVRECCPAAGKRTVYESFHHAPSTAPAQGGWMVRAQSETGRKNPWMSVGWYARK